MKLIQYGSSSLATSENIGVPIIRMNNLQDDELNLTNLKYIELPEKELNLLRLQKGDILFNRTNSKELVGKCAVFREETEYVYASYLIKVRLDETRLLPDFASMFLGSPTGRLQIDCISRQIIGMTNINTEEIKGLKIPIPPIEFQEKAVEQIKKAYAEKKAKEAEAREKLASVDNLVLDALGITLPAKEENTLEKRIFFTKSSDIANSRVDPFYHLQAYKGKEKALHNGKFPAVRLNKVCRQITDGTHFTPIYQDEGILFLSVKNVRRETFDLRAVKYISPKEHAELIKRCKPEAGDVLLTKVGTIGLAAVIPEGLPEFSIFVSVALLKVNKELLNPRYLSLFLNHTLAKFQADRAVKGVGVPDWHLENIRHLEIPIPPPEVQAEIAERVETIYAEAKKLQAEAKEILETAKLQVEAMILGE